MVFMCFSTAIFAVDLTRKARDKNISQNGYTILCTDDDYTLVSDNNGSFFIYWETWTNRVRIYAESGQVTKDYVAEKMREASSSRKIIESRGYTVYRVDKGLFSNSYYFVKTPKGNFYSVSNEIRVIDAQGDSLIDEL